MADIVMETYTEIDMDIPDPTTVDRYAFFCWSCELADSGYWTPEECEEAMEAHHSECSGWFD